jgi:hypothetical protein
MRNMSFMHTTTQIVAGTKFVTRRLGWWFLKGGENIRGVKQARGLKKGQRPHELRQIRVTEVRSEKLGRMLEDPGYGRRECDLEGYPDWPAQKFITIFCKTHKGCTPDSTVNRIAFEYVDIDSQT